MKPFKKSRLRSLALLLSLISLSLTILVTTGCKQGRTLYSSNPKVEKDNGKHIRPTVEFESYTKLHKEATNKAAYYSWSDERLQEEIDRHPEGGYLWVTLHDFNDNQESEPLYMEIVRKSDDRIIWTNSTRSGREKHRPSDYLELSNNKSFYPVVNPIYYPCKVHVTWRGRTFHYELMTPKQEAKFKLPPIRGNTGSDSNSGAVSYNNF